MSIKIKTEKIVSVEGIASRKIISIEGCLPFANLPFEYRNISKESCYMRGSVLTSKGSRTNLCVEGDPIPESTFQDSLEYIKKCGANLHEINMKINKLKESWKGEETFIV